MSAPPGEYYTHERWQNWLDRLADEDLDPEDEESARVLLNLQDDAAIAVAKIVRDHDDGALDEDETLSELADVREIVLTDVELGDEETEILVDGVQTSLICVFAAAEEYVLDGPADEGEVVEYVEAAADAEAEEDLDGALSYCVQAGTLVIDGSDLPVEMASSLEFGLVYEWVNGLDSLQTALSDPAVVEEDEDAED